MTLRAVTFPIYVAAGWSIQLNGSSSREDDVTGLTIAHTRVSDADLLEQRPDLEVTTETDRDRPSATDRARRALEHLVHDQLLGPGDKGELSDGAITLYFRALGRRQRAASLSAARSSIKLLVDGAPTDFLTLTAASGRWVAIGRHRDLWITLAVRDAEPDQIRLERLADPARTLLGPEPIES